VDKDLNGLQDILSQLKGKCFNQDKRIKELEIKYDLIKKEFDSEMKDYLEKDNKNQIKRDELEKAYNENLKMLHDDNIFENLKHKEIEKFNYEIETRNNNCVNIQRFINDILFKNEILREEIKNLNFQINYKLNQKRNSSSSPEKKRKNKFF